MFFWRFFGQKPENLEFCVVFVNKMMFRSFFSPVVWSCFLGEVFAKVSQTSCLSSFLVDFGSVAKSLSRKPRKRECFCMGGVLNVT